ncbi:hypothetical protein DYBT9275_01589 [Dyadobacter sp. CECT 9275]|uniref:DUF4907 domain-containing protein n=1 Tax=Dyadobacter helix TaxID=2822344 RepID=A0A916NBM0_9BACT|nr:DUF4907 domain-containing protein [Dyadobacter sp. CECT 9275]CAG4995245.1 hypothetical protein DYBT9275_01589 [Dyadobacter sp. CECT 9275]
MLKSIRYKIQVAALVVLWGGYLVSCKKGKESSAQHITLPHLKVEAVQYTATAWGYRIYEDTTLIIEQKYLPGIPGTKGFETEALALRTGKLVEKKLKSGVFPPTVTKKELDSLGVKY